MPHRILHNVRQVMPEGGIVALDNGIQDLVCAQLPHACGEYAAAGQRAGDDGGGAAEHRGNEGRVCQAAGLEKRARTTGRSGGHHAAVLASVLSIRSSSTRVSDILDEEVDFGRLRVETLRSGWSGATF